MTPRRVRSTIEYRSTTAGVSHVRGREWLSMTRYPDGTALYRSQSENDDKGLVRDVIMRLDAHWKPVECLFALRSGNQQAGSMHYRFGPGFASADGWNRDEGDVHLRVAVEGTPAGFCPHPVSSDALLLAGYDRQRGGQQRPGPCFMSSTDMFGASGPTLHPIEPCFEFVGSGPLETPVGRLQADQFILPLGSGPASLTEHLWCLAGAPIFLHAEIRGASYPTVFAMTALELEPAAP